MNVQLNKTNTSVAVQTPNNSQIEEIVLPSSTRSGFPTVKFHNTVSQSFDDNRFTTTVTIFGMQSKTAAALSQEGGCGSSAVHSSRQFWSICTNVVIVVAVVQYDHRTSVLLGSNELIIASTAIIDVAPLLLLMECSTRRFPPGSINAETNECTVISKITITSKRTLPFQTSLTSLASELSVMFANLQNNYHNVDEKRCEGEKDEQRHRRQNENQ